MDQFVPVASASKTSVPEDAIEKELMGLTVGFPGGEKGLKLFIKNNPPPPKKRASSQPASIIPRSRPKPWDDCHREEPEYPLLHVLWDRTEDHRWEGWGSI